MIQQKTWPERLEEILDGGTGGEAVGCAEGLLELWAMRVLCKRYLAPGPDTAELADMPLGPVWQTWPKRTTGSGDVPLGCEQMPLGLLRNYLKWKGQLDG